VLGLVLEVLVGAVGQQVVGGAADRVLHRLGSTRRAGSTR
jgi:hypothetical protein